MSPTALLPVAMVTPILIVTDKLPDLVARVDPATVAQSLLNGESHSMVPSFIGAIMRNSSPPMRPTESYSRQHALKIRASSQRTSSPV